MLRRTVVRIPRFALVLAAQRLLLAVLLDEVRGSLSQVLDFRPSGEENRSDCPCLLSR